MERTIDQVKQMAMEDLKFFQELVDDYVAALKKRKIILSPVDIEKLKCCLKYGTYCLTAEQYLKLVSGIRLPIPGVWKC